MRKLRVACVGVLLIGILAGVNRLCFATFDSTVGYQLAEKTAQKEITKDFPDMDLSKATIDVGCSVREYYFFRFRGDIQVLYFWEESGESISVFLNGYFPIWVKHIINRTEKDVDMS